MMKKISSILLLGIFVLFSFNACTDLEEEIYDEALGQNLVNDPANAEALVNPAYGTLRKLSAFWGLWGINEVSTDEAMFPTRGTDWDDGGKWRALHLHTWDAYTQQVVSGWDDNNTGIARCNTGMQYLGNFEQTDEIKTYIAELRFLRAYFAFNLLDGYGQVPYRDINASDFSQVPEVLSGAAAFDWIVTETETAVANLKDKNDLPYGRVNKSAAWMLLAKLYLNKEVYTGSIAGTDWDKVITYTTNVINTGNYTVADDYFGIFTYDNYNSTEPIFVSVFDAAQNLGDNRTWLHPVLHYHMDLGRGGFYGFWNGGCTTEDFLNRWDTTDMRFSDDRYFDEMALNIGFIQGLQYSVDGTPLETREGLPLEYTAECPLEGAAENQGVRVVKYGPDPFTNSQWSQSNDFVFFRISDAFMMRAEAYYRKGKNIAEALTDINHIRTKRGVPELTTLDDQILLNERGFEFYWEGWRRNDMIRFGVFTDAYTNKPVTDGTKTLFPIPQSALDVNPNLTQNPGYTN